MVSDATIKVRVYTGGLIEKSCVAQRLLSLDYLWVFFCSTLTLKSKLCQDQDNCELITAVCKRGDTRIWEGGWAELKYEVRETMQKNSRARAPIGTCSCNIPTDQPTNRPTERHASCVFNKCVFRQFTIRAWLNFSSSLAFSPKKAERGRGVNSLNIYFFL